MAGARLHRSGGAAPRSLAIGLVGLLIGASASHTAFAAPYVGAGEAPIGESGDRTGPRKQALERARRAALEAALAEVEGGEPGRRERILKATSAWTSAYRVLAQGDDGATAKVEVEVEIDVTRLAKVILGASAPTGVRLPAVGRVTHQGCPEALVAGVDDLLVARGLAAAQGEGAALDVALRCESLGLVPQARAWGAQVSVVAGVAGGAGEEARGVAFAGDPDAAAQEALSDALSGVAEALHRQRDGAITLRIATPWPAAQIRRVESALSSSVVGVRAAALGGIAVDGAVLLKIDGTLSADELAARLGALQIPGASLRVVGVDGPRELSATLAP